MPKVLIISPYFPPSNAADMQRVRMSLPYFSRFGWSAEVVCVDEKYSALVKDELLVQSVPIEIPVYKVKAFSKKWTSKFGLGSLALRSLWFLKNMGNLLLSGGKYDLVYFSTTQFAVCVLGAYWKSKFGVPYVIDMQDPWLSTYYLDKPKSQRPPKFWIAYYLNKFLEPIAMKRVGGLISVSDPYVITLKKRYRKLVEIPTATITFGWFDKDFELLNANLQVQSALPSKMGTINITYVGRGGYDMRNALGILFKSFKECLLENPEMFSAFRFHFFGTSYAPSGEGKPTILPVAKEFEVLDYVSEDTDRLPYFQSLKTLQSSNAFVIPGSNDPSYTASKLYPYILAGKPILGIFHELSSAVSILEKCNAGAVVTLQEAESKAVNTIRKFLIDIYKGNLALVTDWKYFEQFSSEQLCKRQIDLFEEVLTQI